MDPKVAPDEALVAKLVELFPEIVKERKEGGWHRLAKQNKFTTKTGPELDELERTVQQLWVQETDKKALMATWHWTAMIYAEFARRGIDKKFCKEPPTEWPLISLLRTSFPEIAIKKTNKEWEKMIQEMKLMGQSKDQLSHSLSDLRMAIIKEAATNIPHGGPTTPTMMDLDCRYALVMCEIDRQGYTGTPQTELILSLGVKQADGTIQASVTRLSAPC